MTEYIYTFEKIVWLDAKASDETWCLSDDLPRCVQVQSHGFVSFEDKSQIVLSASRYWHAGDVWWGESIAIPTGMILSRKQIEVEGIA